MTVCDNPPMSPRPTRSRPTRRLLRPIAIAVVVLQLAACGTAVQTSSPSAPPTASPSSASSSIAPGSPAPSSSPADVSSTFAAIEQDVQAIRGLSLRQPVEPTITDEAGIQRVVETDFNQENPPALIAANERLLKGLGLVPEGASLKDLYLKLLSSQVLGLYQPSTKKFYVLARTGTIGPLERMEQLGVPRRIVAFVLDRLRISDPGQGDRSLAHLAVPEGDATLVMVLWAQQHLSASDLLGLAGSMGPSDQQLLTEMPRILRDTLMFPYTTGLNFVLAQKTTGGWKAVDSLYADPPASTEQLLHPEKYASHEQPVAVPQMTGLTGRIGAGWNETLEDTLGEFQLEIWLEDASAKRVDSATATAAAAGWGGDRRQRIRPGGRDHPRWIGTPGEGPAGRQRDAGDRGHRQRLDGPGPSSGGVALRRLTVDIAVVDYIDSGAEIPSRPSAFAMVMRVAATSASRRADRSGSSGSSTRASR